ncbi:hypothetical protein P3X46_007617 [Hevea brasiliensis]|uniref:CASP-like protein n=1 Tax=Hevea brasiliensis TaxID=3981 RepID=A0ABQ9MW32_HEVBR|nr:hypothetical protein P3X46_007617 [Hevea brasiliensis]
MPDPEIPASVITIARGLSLFVASLPAKSMLRRLFVVLDVNGDSQAYWPAICGQVPTYCDHLMGAIVAGLICAGIYLLIIIYSISISLNHLLEQ